MYVLAGSRTIQVLQRYDGTDVIPCDFATERSLSQHRFTSRLMKPCSSSLTHSPPYHRLFLIAAVRQGQTKPQRNHTLHQIVRSPATKCIKPSQQQNGSIPQLSFAIIIRRTPGSPELDYNMRAPLPCHTGPPINGGVVSSL